ncbi:MAG: nitroreductase family protein [Bacteroidales bacterium]|nr:nitroreductase family protein [Bacteroidales bacterium]
MIKRITLIAAAAVALMLLPGCGGSEKQEAASVQSFDEIVAARRSIRDYKEGTTISTAQVRDLIATAMEAPSWANSQTTRYYVAMDPDKVAAVKELVGAGNARNTANAPVMIVSTFVKDQSGFGRGNQANEIGNGWGAYDNGLSNAFFILKAREQGFDTLIMGMRDSDGLRKIFNIPDTEEVMAVISLGYRASDPNRPARKPIDDIVKFF